MLAIRSAAAVLLLGSTQFCFAQDSLFNNGNCNGNVQGSGNVVYISCPSGSVGQNGMVWIVLTADSWAPVGFATVDQFNNPVQFNFAPGIVDIARSNFLIQIEHEQFYEDFASAYNGGSLEVGKGRHPYFMEVNVQYFNGGSGQARCRGIIDVQSNATLYPRFRVYVNPMTGQFQSGGCWFSASEG